MKRRLTYLLIVACAASAGCVETVSVKQAQTPLPQVLVATPRGAWSVIEDGEQAGYVLRFESSERKNGFHSIRNPWNQELGLVDSEGRAWRYRPHGQEPEWLGTGTVQQGTRRILALQDAVLEPVSLTDIRGR